MKTFLLLLCLLLFFHESTSFHWDWNRTDNKMGGTIYACMNGNVHFPYPFQLKESETLSSMTWAYHGNNSSRGICTLFLNELLVTQHYSKRAEVKTDGNFVLQRITAEDNGDYTLKLQIKDPESIIYNTLDVFQKISLFVAEKFMYKGDNLVAEISDNPVWNSTSRSFSLTLKCGNFIFKNGDAPMDVVEWLTPNGTAMQSTGYFEGNFHLQLAGPIKWGRYTCKVPDKGSVCATTNDNIQATVNVDEHETQIFLLRKENEKLQETIQKQNATIYKLDRAVIENCGDVLTARGRTTFVLPKINKSVEVYCNQDTAGGGWNVFQRRQDGRENFYRGWSDYRQGFGDLDNGFWLGLETLHQMTSDGRKYELRIDMEKQNGSKYYAEYDDFTIGSECEGYVVSFKGYRGNAGDMFKDHNNMKFTTKDRDQDRADGVNCAQYFHSGWWFDFCFQCNLNGVYGSSKFDGISWNFLTHHKESLKRTVMMFRLKQD